MQNPIEDANGSSRPVTCDLLTHCNTVNNTAHSDLSAVLETELMDALETFSGSL